jgi:lipopolysaccharide biosynthesis glycosyltransferase
MESRRVTTLAFVACVERGELEKKTLLLCRSIRRFGGSHAEAPVYTFQPRAGTAISRHTEAQLADLGVVHSTEQLNSRFAHYAIGNKIFAAARAEELAAEDVVVFLDSDTVIVNEPKALELGDRIDAAVRPVDMHRSATEPEDDGDPFWKTRYRRVSSSGPGDPMDDYWLRMYELLGVDPRPFVETTCSRQRIRAYFNSGLIAVRRSAGLFGQWRDDFVRLMEAKLIPRNGPLHYMDQLSLAATLTRVWDRVLIPDGRYNYPLPGRDALREPFRSMPLEEAVHIHYNSMYDGVARWLEPQLAEAACN